MARALLVGLALSGLLLAPSAPTTAEAGKGAVAKKVAKRVFKYAKKAASKYPAAAKVMNVAARLLGLVPQEKGYEEMKKEWEAYTKKRISKALQGVRDDHMTGLRNLLQSVENANTTADLWEAWHAIHVRCLEIQPTLMPKKGDSALLALPSYAGALHLHYLAIDRLLAILEFGGPRDLGTPYGMQRVETYVRSRRDLVATGLRSEAERARGLSRTYLASLIDAARAEYIDTFRIKSEEGLTLGEYDPDTGRTRSKKWETHEVRDSTNSFGTFSSKKEAQAHMAATSASEAFELWKELLSLYSLPELGEYLITFSGVSKSSGVVESLKVWNGGLPAETFESKSDGADGKFIEDVFEKYLGKVKIVWFETYEEGGVTLGRFTVILRRRSDFLNARKYLLGGITEDLSPQASLGARLNIFADDKAMRKGTKEAFRVADFLSMVQDSGRTLTVSASAHEGRALPRNGHPSTFKKPYGYLLPGKSTPRYLGTVSFSKAILDAAAR